MAALVERPSEAAAVTHPSHPLLLCGVSPT